MTKKEAKRRACVWLYNVLSSDATDWCAAHQDDSDDERSAEDYERMTQAFWELTIEMARRGGASVFYGGDE